jgi:AcrR family transcriptional regulator
MPLSDCEVRDPRMRRTRQLLQGALESLLRTKAFDEITVQDITEAATVNRATFYDHYTDKFALLEAIVAGGFHRLLHERGVSYDGDCAGAAGSIILAACDYLTLARAGSVECQRQSAFEPLADAAMVAAIRRVLAGGLARPSASGAGLSPELGEMRATAASWAIYGAVKEWFRTPNRSSAEAAVPAILEMVTPLLATTESTAASVASRSVTGQTRQPSVDST